MMVERCMWLKIKRRAGALEAAGALQTLNPKR